MANGRFNYPLFKAWTAWGAHAAGYRLYTYKAGTSTPCTTYQDADNTTAHANPIVLNSLGEAEIYLAESTKFTLTDEDGNIQTGWPVDDVDPTTVNASDVSYTPTGGSITSEDVQAAIEEIELELLGKVDTVDSQSSVYPNRVINPEMMIDQRNEGAATTTADTYTVDRWLKTWSGTSTLVVSAQQTTGIGDGRNSNKFTVSTGEAAMAAAESIVPFRYKFLGYDIADLAGETVTVSFYFKSNFTGTYSISLVAGDAGYSYVTDFSYDTAAAEQLVTKAIVIDSSNAITDTTTGIGLYLNIAALAGTNYNTSTTDAWTVKVTNSILCSTDADNWAATSANYVQISSVQLRKGSAYMPLSHKTRTEYLSECQAYYCKSYNQGVVPGTNTWMGQNYFVRLSGSMDVEDRIVGSVKFPVTMISDSPTINIYSTNTGAINEVYDNKVGEGDKTINIVNYYSDNGFSSIDMTDATTENGPCGFHYTASAEI